MLIILIARISELMSVYSQLLDSDKVQRRLADGFTDPIQLSQSAKKSAKSVCSLDSHTFCWKII